MSKQKRTAKSTAGLYYVLENPMKGGILHTKAIYLILSVL